MTAVEPSSEQLAQQRSEFLSNPPSLDAPPEPAPVVDDENAVLDELSQTPPAGGKVEPTSVDAPPAGGTPDDPFASYGGRQNVDLAFQVQEALRTEAGVKVMVAQGLEALGYSADRIKAALGGGAMQAPVTSAPEGSPEPSPFDGIEDDDVVTGADVKRLLGQVAAQTAKEAADAVRAELNPLRAQVEEERNRDIAARNDATLTELLGAFPTTQAEQDQYRSLAAATLQAAGAFIDPSNFDPNHIRAAIVKGHEAVIAEQDRRFAAYIARKRATRDAAPSNIGGASAGEAGAAEPKSLNEAREQLRAQNFFGDR